MQGAAFVCVAAAPDAVVLVGLQREGEAMGSDRADGADGLSLLGLGDGPAGLPDREEELYRSVSAPINRQLTGRRCRPWPSRPYARAHPFVTKGLAAGSALRGASLPTPREAGPVTPPKAGMTSPAFPTDNMYKCPEPAYVTSAWHFLAPP